MRTRMMISAVCVSLLVLASIGCDQEQSLPTSALLEARPDEQAAPTAALSKFFTGRDSFGVAMKMRLDGSEVVTVNGGRCGEDDTVELSGTGNATHLGRVEGTISHCVDTEFYDGRFEIIGAGGAFVVGVYGDADPPADPPVVDVLGKQGEVIETKADINGGEVDAVQRDDVEGRGDLRILLKPDGGFALTFDGWLLHHLAEE